jgi:hypothetical protein
MVSPFAATPVRGLADDITKMTSPDLVQVSNKQDEGGGGGGDEASKAERPEITAVTTKYDLEDALKRQSEGKAAAEKARQAAIYEEYKPQLTQRFEQFQPPKDTFQGLASLGMMMMAVGSMGGKKGLTSATGAMNAIAGMATGYQQGRKEEFDRQKAIFDENFRIMKENQAQIEKEFQYALKYAKTDLTGATNKMIQSRAAAGDNVTKESIEKNGLIPTYNEHRQATAKYNEVAEKQKAYRDAQVALLRKQLEQKEAEEKIKSEKSSLDIEKEKAEVQLKQQELARGGVSAADLRAKEERKVLAQQLKNNNIRPRNDVEAKAWGENFPNEPFPKETSKEAEGIKGQIKYVKNYLGDEADDLGTKELPKVASTIEAAKLSVDLADKINKNPEAAGIVGSTLSFFDKYIPSRYQGTDIADPDRLAYEAANNQDLFKNIPADKIAAARDIQKMVVDVINARALAASGGNRMLIAEFNAQKNVLGLGDLSPQSAVNLYTNVARRDLKALQQFGVSDEGLNKIYKKIQPRFASNSDVAETARANNLSINEAIKKLKAAGYAIEGE